MTDPTNGKAARSTAGMTGMSDQGTKKEGGGEEATDWCQTVQRPHMGLEENGRRGLGKGQKGLDSVELCRSEEFSFYLSANGKLVEVFRRQEILKHYCVTVGEANCSPFCRSLEQPEQKGSWPFQYMFEREFR